MEIKLTEEEFNNLKVSLKSIAESLAGMAALITDENKERRSHIVGEMAICSIGTINLQLDALKTAYYRSHLII